MGDRVQRWNLAERVEHKILVVCTPLFIITGLPLFARSVFGWMIQAPLTVDAFRMGHRIAIGLFLGVAVFHVLYHIIALKGRSKIWVTGKDVRDAIQQIKFYMGMAKKPPTIGFHGPAEKITAYWLMSVLFMLVMGASGIVLLFPSSFAVVANEWALLLHDVFFILTTCILIFHFYMSTLHPEHRPALNSVFTDGTVPVEYAKHEHALWYKELHESKK